MDKKKKRGILRATHDGELVVGDISIPCVVLEDGTRVLSQRGVAGALGRGAPGGAQYAKIKREKGKDSDIGVLPPFLAPNSLKPFISPELAESVKDTIYYIPLHGGRAYGLAADLLMDVCQVWMKARDAGALHHTQSHLAEKAQILHDAFAKVGVIAVIDEVTGYQSVRRRHELHELLSVYLAEERLAWAKTFPDVFYREIYRLKGWKFPGNHHRTPLIGKITNDIIYERLPRGVLAELKKRNPVPPGKKTRRHRHFQFLSEDIGQPDLRDTMIQVMALMRASVGWKGFERILERALPKTGQMELELDDE